MKEKWVYVCQQCGKSQSKWMGRCPDCGTWNSLVEERSAATTGPKRAAASRDQLPVPIRDVAAEQVERWKTDLSEWDNVLGGGLVPGSVLLLGGEPGIGKSTLLLQAGELYAKAGRKVLYASGEESPSQIALRAARLDVASDRLFLLAETDFDAIERAIDSTKPDLLVIDSIQTIYSPQLESQPGSVGQLRECSYRLIGKAKERGMASVLVGHVTKEGAIAGPKVLEHMVDVVLYFEGTSNHTFRLLRAMKNRFGSTNELGVFEMTGKGMREVTNPSELFLSERSAVVPGSAIVAAVEGTRPILVEAQALVSKTPLAIPRRTAIGMDPNRLALMVAILEKRGGFQFFDQDIYVNIVGGLKLTEPAVDLGILAAILSSYSGKPVENETAFVGEVGLGGEIRSVPRTEARVREAARVGMKRMFLPKRVASELGSVGLKLVGVEHVGELTDFL